MTKNSRMKKKFCPNCGNKKIKHHEFKHYDPGYKYTCGSCQLDFDDPSSHESPKRGG